MALMYTPPGELGSACPDFSLPGTDGKTYGRTDFAGSRALIVMFICNHCPYVQAVENRLVALANEVQPLGAKIVAISSNDAVKYPADSFEKMRERVLEKGYSFPYLYDESQDIAKTFGAVCTPDFFLYDQNQVLAYRGRLDDSWKDETQVTKRELREAILNLLEGQPVAVTQYPSMGCSIKWKAL